MALKRPKGAAGTLVVIRIWLVPMPAISRGGPNVDTFTAAPKRHMCGSGTLDAAGGVVCWPAADGSAVTAVTTMASVWSNGRFTGSPPADANRACPALAPCLRPMAISWGECSG